MSLSLTNQGLGRAGVETSQFEGMEKQQNALVSAVPLNALPFLRGRELSTTAESKAFLRLEIST